MGCVTFQMHVCSWNLITTQHKHSVELWGHIHINHKCQIRAHYFSLLYAL